MLTVLGELDASFRNKLFFVANVILVLWTRYLIAPARVGWPRLILAVPMFAISVLICLLFDFNDPTDQALMPQVITNYGWLVQWKIFGLCVSRSQLTRAYESGSFSAFVVALLFNVNVAFETKPYSEAKKNDEDTAKQNRVAHTYEDVRFAAVKHKGFALVKEIFHALIRVVFKTCMLLVFAYLVKTTERHSFRMAVICSWYFFFTFSGLQDAALLISLVTLGLELAPNFDQPYLSTSVEEFWSKRWNRVMGTQLREIIYEPICENRWIASGNYFDKTRSSISRRVIGTFFTFLASGIIHVVMMLLIDPSIPIPYLHGSFFVVNSFLVMLEIAIKKLVRKSYYFSKVTSRIPSVFYILYVQVTLQVIGYYLFWPDLIKSDGLHKFADSILSVVPEGVFP